MADNIDKLTAAIEKLNGNFNAFQNVMQQNIMQRQDGKGRYPGYTPFFGGENSLEKALKELERAQRTSKNAGNFGARLLGLDDAMYKGEQIKRFREEVEETKKTLEDINKEIEKSQKEYKNLEKQLGKNKKLIEDVIDDYHDLLDTGKEKSEIDDELINKYGITKSELDDIISKEGTLNALKAKGNDLQEEELKKINTQTKLYGEQANLFEQKFSAIERGYDTIVRGGSQILNVGKQFAEAWMKVETASSNFARSVGIGSKGMASITNNAISTIQKTNWSDLYGVGMEDMVKLQEAYMKGTGRQVGMSTTDLEKSIGLSKIMGDKGGQLAASLENFGLSYSASADIAGKMFKDASKYGLSFEKYSDNFLQNIKMAQNYTFKNGLKGLESMARKATAIKLDMQQISNFADKVGTLQGAVETSAQLQVLGGPFAQFANPLQMLNESMTDMEGLMDRFTNMVGGLGRFDTTTGEVKVGAFDKQRIRAAAQAMGMDYGQVMESVMTQGRRNYVSGKIGSLGLSDTEKEFVTNTANVKNGQVLLSYTDKNGNRQEISAAQAKQSGILSEIMRQNSSESDDVRNIAQDTRTLKEQLTGLEEKKDAVRAKIFSKVQDPIKNIITKISNNVSILVALMSGGALLKAGATIFGGGKSLLGGIGGGAGHAGTISKTMKKIPARPSNVPKGAKLKVTKNGKYIWQEGDKIFSDSGKNISNLKNVKNVAKTAKSVSKFGKFAKFGGGIFAGVTEGLATGIDEFGGKKDYGKNAKGKSQNWKKYGRTAGSAIGAGAATFGLGAALAGTGVGLIPGLLLMAAGGVAGGALGKNFGGGFANQNRRARKKSEFGLENLRGDYSVRELKAIAEGRAENDDKLMAKIKANNDYDAFKQAIEKLEIEKQEVHAKEVKLFASPNEQYANGGILRGPSHARGGMKIQGSNVEVEGGEFVVNKQSTARHLSELNKINADKYGNGGIIKPRKAENGGMLTVLPISAFNKQRLHAAQEIIGGQNKPIEVNINGTLKLDAGNGINKDILGDLVKNPVFIRQITKLIEQQMTINNKGGNVINKGLYNAS